ncbi:MAG: HD domain-containing protein [Bacteroidota bacterium]
MEDYKGLLNPIKLFRGLQILADELEIPTYAVGGFVRDQFLDRDCKDIDIVCVGDSIALAKAFARQHNHAKVTIFKQFGTAMVRWQDFQVEFVSARKESYQRDSRKPKVVAGSLEDDILRRDFTVNALAIKLNKDGFGTLIDLCGGIKDLQAGVIRTPLAPLRTFSDDPLRMFRGVRFARQLDFALVPEVVAAIQKEAHRVEILSKERIITELNKILMTKRPSKGLALLDQVGLLGLVLPEMMDLKGVSKINGKSHKDNFLHTLQVVENVAKILDGPTHPKYLWLIWAAILHDIAKPATKRFDPKLGFTFHGHEKLGAKMVPRIFKRLGLPMGAEMRYVKKLIWMHLRHIPLVEQDVTAGAIRRFIHDAGNELEDLLVLCRADITSKNERKVAHYLANFDKLAKKIAEVEASDKIRNMKLAIDGQMIMQTFGLRPCAQVGKIKEAIKEAVLRGDIPNEHKAAYAYMLAYAKNLDLLPVQHGGENV